MRVARVKRKSRPKATLIQISRLLARDLAMGEVIWDDLVNKDIIVELRVNIIIMWVCGVCLCINYCCFYSGFLLVRMMTALGESMRA